VVFNSQLAVVTRRPTRNYDFMRVSERTCIWQIVCFTNYLTRTNVSELLRNFPKVRRAALAGERVVIETREGNLVLTAEKPAARSLFRALADAIEQGKSRGPIRRTGIRRRDARLPARYPRGAVVAGGRDRHHAPAHARQIRDANVVKTLW
jgi:hypothetical protein